MSRNDDDHLLDHNYDGIQEYDNPLPFWWTAILWATVVFSVLYLLNVPGIGIGRGRIANYEREMERARAARSAEAAAAPQITEQTLLAIVADPARMTAGKTAFVNCVPCHRADGGGMIGPNLTDDYWIHGGRPLEILKTVTEGVPAKGMPAWGQMLKPDEVQAVAAYVIALKGTHPEKPKGPEGLRADSVAAASTTTATGGPGAGAGR